MDDREYDGIINVVRKELGVSIRGDNMPVSIRRHKRERLISLWETLGYKVGVEVGVQRGYFTREVMTRNTSIRWHCVDPWSDYEGSWRTPEGQEGFYQQTLKNLEPYINQGRVQVLRAASLDIVKEFGDAELDVVFVDGDHTFDHAVRDIIEWSRVLRPGGMMCVHDYLALRGCGVMEAVNAYTHCHCINPWFVTREVYPTAFWIKR